MFNIGCIASLMVFCVICFLLGNYFMKNKKISAFTWIHVDNITDEPLRKLGDTILCVLYYIISAVCGLTAVLGMFGVVKFVYVG